ncbi:MAG TPA: hypothetical protein VH985_08475 [Candidatus Binatia bacterium]
MKYLNDLHRKYPQNHKQLGEHKDATAMIPDKLTFRWWQLFCAVSVGNIVLWSLAAQGLLWESDGYRSKQLVLSGLFVAACAFRSILPRVDLERMCLWDSPLSSVIVGRTVATVAELCFAWQCALLLFKLSALTGSSVIGTIGLTVLPIIVVAELACWFAVATLNHIGHAVEELLWSIMVGLIAVALVIYGRHTAGTLPMWVPIGLIACAGTAVLILAVDVPLYIARWRIGKRAGLRYLRVIEGLKDAVARRRVTQAREHWREEVLWMSLYFSVAVWVSLAIIFV